MLEDFIGCAIAATGKDGVTALENGLLGENAGAAGGGGFHGMGFDACGTEDSYCICDDGHAPC